MWSCPGARVHLWFYFTVRKVDILFVCWCWKSFTCQQLCWGTSAALIKSLVGVSELEPKALHELAMWLQATELSPQPGKKKCFLDEGDALKCCWMLPCVWVNTVMENYWSILRDILKTRANKIRVCWARGQKFQVSPSYIKREVFLTLYLIY